MSSSRCGSQVYSKMEAEVTSQICSILEEYNVCIAEVACSTAVFLLSVKDGHEVTQRVAKWFHPDSGERFFVKKSPLFEVEEYFALVLFEDEEHEEVKVHAVSFGILKKGDRCYDAWSLKTEFPSSVTMESSAGYIVEVACIEQEKVLDLTDFRGAKHIETKYLQRRKNVAHYYPSRPGLVGSSFATVVERPLLSAEEEWVYEKAQKELHQQRHAWEFPDSDGSDVAKAYWECQRGTELAHIAGGRHLKLLHPLPETNTWGCLMYDIAAQSLKSASIPRTRLHIPWVITRAGKERLALKMVV